jgi:hypothetical protein
MTARLIIRYLLVRTPDALHAIYSYFSSSYHIVYFYRSLFAKKALTAIYAQVLAYISITYEIWTTLVGYLIHDRRAKPSKTMLLENRCYVLQKVRRDLTIPAFLAQLDGHLGHTLLILIKLPSPRAGFILCRALRTYDEGLSGPLMNKLPNCR